MSRSLILLLLLLQYSLAWGQIADSEMISFTPSAGQQLRLYWKDDQGRVIGSLGRLKDYTAAKKQKLVFAMNGGMYTEDRSPLGLFIQDSKTLKARNIKKGYGNFYLAPNGVFYTASNGKGFVCTTNEFRPDKDIRYATQSGPMLVINGKIHSAFKKGSVNLNVRNGVGILPGGRMLFAMSKKEVNLYDFAEYFRRKGCRNALFLDGFVSRTYLPALSWLQTDGYFGVIIGVTG
ncbi:phosphodiester glycosidase family protein [Taibaiella koreensis]|uniref:phosphodiester glycosidase family protein n=1 Tax=Taibaiella koreensis TaxID=1268548 RepID=UPI000E5A09C9|nr:phosphodiester glycosidase family protein [Taibaiella koreensis]